jgi:hypothetical protein
MFFQRSVFMLSLAKPYQFYQHLLSQGFGMGIGMGLMFLPALSVPSHYFRARRSIAMGVVLAGALLAFYISATTRMLKLISSRLVVGRCDLSNHAQQSLQICWICMGRQVRLTLTPYTGLMLRKS